MGKKQSKAFKKRRISKHIREAEERKKKEAIAAALENGEEIPTLPEPNAAPKKKVKQQNHIKDPSEAHNYLSAWKHREASPGVWKFNKNTQSWICKNMYDPEKIPKKYFDILLEYLEDLKGILRKRTHEDALKRAMRYKEWEKKSSEKTNGGEKGDDENAEVAKNTDNDDIAGGNDDEKKFNEMSAHDKRKEYKRARKIIDMFKKHPQPAAI